MDRLRGLNFGGWLSQIDAIREKDPGSFPGTDTHMERFVGRDDFLRQKEWGFNHVRLPVDSGCFFDDNDDPMEHRLGFIDKAATWAGEAGLALVLDLHECPGHDFADATVVPVQKLFTDPGYLRRTEKIWTVLAERYGGFSHVCFEVLNEPVAPAVEMWNTVKDRLCHTIRKSAPSSQIIVGSNMWNWPSTFNEITPVSLDGIIYSFHFYEPLLFTHQGAPWMHEPEIRQSRTYPADYGRGFTRKYGFVHSAGLWDKNRMSEEIGTVVEFGKRCGKTVVCNEFGVYAPVPLDLQIRWLKDLLGVLKENGIGFSYWNYRNLDFGIVSKGEQLHQSLPQYDNPERINYQVLGLLREN
jgi:hypothetical protein